MAEQLLIERDGIRLGPVARAAGGQGDARIVLMAGVVVGAFANAAIMVALANAQDNVVRGALWWMMGSVSDANWAQVRLAALWVAVGIVALLALARAIDVLALGEDTAAGLGVRVAPVTPDTAENLGLEKVRGAVIAEAQVNGPAARAGLEGGDVVTSVNGEPVESAHELVKKIGSMSPGSAVELGVRRNGEDKMIVATLGELPVSSRQAHSSRWTALLLARRALRDRPGRDVPFRK